MIKKPAWRDACGHAFGMYRMNATTAIGYAFTVTDDGKEANTGEFIFSGEDHGKDLFDGFVQYNGKNTIDAVLFDNTTGKAVPIANKFPEVRRIR